MKNIIVILVVIVLGFAVYYFFFRAPATSTPTTATPAATLPPTTTTSPAAAPVQSTAAVNIAGFAFSPATLNVKVGATVTWTNNDTVPHTVTSDTNGLLKSSTLSPGQSFSFTFTKTGTTQYHCTIHPMMKGTVVVTS